MYGLKLLDGAGLGFVVREGFGDDGAREGCGDTVP
jgi:hypothetical protein